MNECQLKLYLFIAIENEIEMGNWVAREVGGKRAPLFSYIYMYLAVVLLPRKKDK